MKTIEVNGKIYEIGKLYQDEYGNVGVLIGAYNMDNPFKFAQIGSGETYLRRVAEKINENQLGIIKDAPIKLVEGEWYMCHWEVQTGNETCEHIRQPLRVVNGCFETPANALLLKPLYRMVKG